MDAESLKRAVQYGLQNGKKNMIVDLPLLGAVLAGHVPVGNNVLSPEDVTEKLYQLREQRDKLLHACEIALGAYDEALKTGKSTIWNGENIDKMRAAVNLSRPREPLICANCNNTSTSAGQFLNDRRWVCTESCRKELCEKQSYDDLAASGGIVDAP